MSILSASSRLLFSFFTENRAIIRQMITTISFLDKKIPHIYFLKVYVREAFILPFFYYFLLPERTYQKEPERKIEE